MTLFNVILAVLYFFGMIYIGRKDRQSNSLITLPLLVVTGLMVLGFSTYFFYILPSSIILEGAVFVVPLLGFSLGFFLKK